MEFIKNNIVIDKRVGREVSQILLEGDIIVPDVKPDIDEILEVLANQYIDSKEVSNGRVGFKGILDINVLYISKDENKNVSSINTSTDFEDFINIDGLEKDMNVMISSKITNVEYKIINDRKISYRIVVEVIVDGFCKEEAEGIVDIEGLLESQKKKSKYYLNKIVCIKYDRVIIKDELKLPSSKPNINELLQCDISIRNKDVKLMEDRLNVSGELSVNYLYKGDNNDGILEYVESEIPFNGAIEALGASSEMMSESTFFVQNKKVNILSDDSGEDRILEIEVEIGCNLKVTDDYESEVLTDAFCINKNYDMEKNVIKYPVLVCCNKNQVPIKENIKLENSPSILQIIKLDGQIIVDDIKILNNKIAVEGVINTNIVYVANSDNKPVCCYFDTIPYTHIIDAQGVREDEEVSINVDSYIEHIGVNILSDKEVEVRVVSNFDICVSKDKDMCLLIDIIESDIPQDILDNIGSITLYVVQKGDTLWEIAKRYNTTIDAIVEINDIENPDLIYPGDKLIIVK